MIYDIMYKVNGLKRQKVGTISKLSELQSILNQIDKETPEATDLTFTVTTRSTVK